MPRGREPFRRIPVDSYGFDEEDEYAGEPEEDDEEEDEDEEDIADGADDISPRLLALLTPDYAQSLTDTRSYGAGQDYFKGSAVRRLEVSGDKVVATVRGTENYRVKLTARGSDLDYECSCPWHEDTDAFCKHCVAVVLAFYVKYGRTSAPASNASTATAKKRPNDKVTPEDLRVWLEAKSSVELAKIILERTEQDTDWQTRLFLRVAADRKGDDANWTALRRVIREITEIQGVLEYQETREFAERAEDVVETLSSLEKRGEATAARELAEFAIDRFTKVMNKADDSSGRIGGLIQDLIDIHAEACAASHLDPRALARELLERELNDGYGLWDGVAERYEAALGETGQAEFRRQLFAQWEKLPMRSESRQGRYDDASVRESHLQRMIETIARREKDTDLLLRVLRRDLSSDYAYLQIAEACAEAKRYDDALAWAEKGKATFPKIPSDRLDDFLIQEYQRRRWHDKATVILWRRFETRLGLSAYQELQKYTHSIGQWLAWREKALELLRKKIADGKSTPTKGLPVWQYPAHRDGSMLVEIFLWENRIDAAWEVAQSEGCTPSLWLRLAQEREGAHPDDSLAVYRRLLPEILDQTTGKYEEPLALLLQIRDLMYNLKRDREFQEYVEELRTGYKRKRNFISLLNARGL